jgi:hypothetical protein
MREIFYIKSTFILTGSKTLVLNSEYLRYPNYSSTSYIYQWRHWVSDSDNSISNGLEANSQSMALGEIGTFIVFMEVVESRNRFQIQQVIW